jgi:hypothetical protein
MGRRALLSSNSRRQSCSTASSTSKHEPTTQAGSCLHEQAELSPPSSRADHTSALRRTGLSGAPRSHCDKHLSTTRSLVSDCAESTSPIRSTSARQKRVRARSMSTPGSSQMSNAHRTRHGALD